jgi:putative ATP-dependent endonuclease of the OLD family
VRISRISITNFRSIQKLDLDLPQVCALVGPNNSGKSNILECIHRVIGRDWVSVSSFAEEDVFGRDPDKDILVQLTFDPPLQYKKYAYGEAVDIATLSFEYTRYKVGAEKGQRRLEQKCYDRKGKAPMVLAKAPRAGQQREYAPVVNIPSEVREALPVIFIGTSRSIKDQLPSARASLLRQLFEDINADFNDPKQTIEVQKDGKTTQVPRREYFGDLMEQVLALLKTESLTELEKSIKEKALAQLGFDVAADADKLDFFFAPFDSIDFYKSLDLRIREFGTTISATELGQGFQNALVISILQAFEERKKQGAILLIEEPEMFLHPQMQRSLYKTLREIGKTNQVIYTTHSPHFVSVPEFDQVVLVRKGPEGTRATRSPMVATDKLKEKFIKELDPERNELFFASRLLLVEGDTEKLATPEYAKRLGIDLDTAGATIIEVSGKRNLPEFLNLAESLEIPVGVVYDEDSSDFKKEQKEEEQKFNAELDKRQKPDGSVRIWRLTKNFEDHLRKTIGEQKYQELCQIYPLGKPSRARLIAQQDLPVPNPFTEIVLWLSNAMEKAKFAKTIEGEPQGPKQ